MAIVKHRSSKNARYEDVLEYYTCKHREDSRTGHYEPLLDAYGLLQPRDNCTVLYLTAEGEEAAPENWASACRRTNLQCGKNNKRTDRKSHEYILSHPSADREKMSMSDLLEEARAFARTFLQGYDCLLAVHRDTGNDHIHISINSVRALAREERGWMMRDGEGNALPCEVRSGGKHQDSTALRQAMNDWLRDYTRAHQWEVKDNNAIAAQRKQARYQKRNEYLRHALISVAAKCHSTKELSRRLHTYGITLKMRGHTVSAVPPGGHKAVRLRTLELEWEDIEELMALRRAQDRLAEQQWRAYIRAVYRSWYGQKQARLREKSRRTRGVLISLLLLVIYRQAGASLLPDTPLLHGAEEAVAFFGPPDRDIEKALRGLSYARQQDLQTPQEIEWKEAELRSAIRRAKEDYDKAALEAAMAEWRSFQDLQLSIRALQYAQEWRLGKSNDELEHKDLHTALIR